VFLKPLFDELKKPGLANKSRNFFGLGRSIGAKNLNTRFNLGKMGNKMGTEGNSCGERIGNTGGRFVTFV